MLHKSLWLLWPFRDSTLSGGRSCELVNSVQQHVITCSSACLELVSDAHGQHTRGKPHCSSSASISLLSMRNAGISWGFLSKLGLDLMRGKLSENEVRSFSASPLLLHHICLHGREQPHMQCCSHEIMQVAKYQSCLCLAASKGHSWS